MLKCAGCIDALDTIKTKEVKLYKSLWKAVKIFALTIPLVMGEIWLIIREDSDLAYRIVGWVNCLFFVLGTSIGLFQLLDRRPQIVISGIGL